MTPIRPVTPQDLPQLAKLVQREGSWVKYISDKVRHRDTEMLVASEDGQLVGFIDFRVVQRGRQAEPRRHAIARWFRPHRAEPDAILQPLRFGLIEELYVAPARRKQGWGRALVESCVHSLQKQAVSEIQTAIYLNNHSSLDFFHKLGFEASKFLLRKRVGQIIPPLTTIRPATRRDIPQLAELVRQAVEYQQRLARSFQLLPQVDWAGYVSAKRKQRDIEILVAFQDRHLVGFIELRVVQPFDHNGVRGRLKALARQLLPPFLVKGPLLLKGVRFGFIEDIYILPAWRKQGLATALVQESMRWFQSQQVAYIQAGIWKDNEISLTFFQNLDFKPIKVMLSKRGGKTKYGVHGA